MYRTYVRNISVVRCVDINSEEISEKTIEYFGNPSNEAVTEKCKELNLILLKVISTKTTKCTFSMKDEDFIKVATLIKESEE